MPNSEISEEKRLALRKALENINSRLRVTKIVCTRSVYGRNGESYVGFSAPALDSTQDDAGGDDLISTQDDVSSRQGMTLRESRLAALVLALQSDISANNHAWAGGGITSEERNEAVRTIRANYTMLMLSEMEETNGGKVE